MNCATDGDVRYTKQIYVTLENFAVFFCKTLKIRAVLKTSLNAHFSQRPSYGG